jgi:hypothetical protein
MPLREKEFRCFCCKVKVEALEGSICIDVYKNGRYAMRGICPHKKCSLSKFISKEKAEKLKSKYSDCPVSSSDSKVVEAGGVFALFALLAGAVVMGIKSAKSC